MNNHFNCIYMYTNKINGKRYIGQTVDFKQRHSKHISSSYNKKEKYGYNYPFHRAIRKYGIENFEIKILAENIPTQEKMNEYEKFFIKRYDTLCKNGKGYNLADGGSNGNVFAGKTEEEMSEIFNDEWKRKQSETKMGENNPMYGRTGENAPMYGIHRYGKDAPNYGKHHSEATKRKMSQAQKGKNNPRAKRVAQYDLGGNLIRIWDYAKQVEEELGINNGNIIQCCKFCEIDCNKEEWFKTHKNRPYKTAGGYIWKYVEDIRI